MKAVRFARNFVNHNPKNLERLKLKPKPSGWGFEREAAKMNCTYRLDYDVSEISVKAAVHHYKDGPIIQVSTTEESIRLQNCSKKTIAYEVGRVLVSRCAMMGIDYCKTFEHKIEKIFPERAEMQKQFLKALHDGGLALEEPEVYQHIHLYDPEKTWDHFAVRPSRYDKLDELDLTMEPGKGVC